MKITRLLVTIVIACSLVAVVSAQRQKRRCAGTLVDANKPAVFISFLRSGEVEPLETGVGNRYLWFRLTNNSRWAIWLDMSGVPKAYGDAGLFYTIESEEDGKIRIDSRCHVCAVNPVRAGRLVVFSIPADYAGQDVRMRIEYSFAWERDNEMEGGSYSVHSVLFYFSYLPKSVLPTAGVAGFDRRRVSELAGRRTTAKPGSRPAFSIFQRGRLRLRVFGELRAPIVENQRVRQSPDHDDDTGGRKGGNRLEHARLN
jgi:hypothetical protein